MSPLAPDDFTQPPPVNGPLFAHEVYCRAGRVRAIGDRVLRFEDRGEKQLTGVPDAWRLVALAS